MMGATTRRYVAGVVAALAMTVYAASGERG